MLQVASTNEEKVPITATPITRGGKPAAVDGALRVTVFDGDSTFEQDPAFPLVFTVVSSDTPGTTHFKVEADADLGAGVTLISDTVEYVVSSAEATSFGLMAGTAIPK